MFNSVKSFLADIFGFSKESEVAHLRRVASRMLVHDHRMARELFAAADIAEQELQQSQESGK